MIHNFNTNDQALADACLLVYTVYRSRTSRFKNDTRMWDRIARFTEAAANAAQSIPNFIDRFSNKMQCDALKLSKNKNHTLVDAINAMTDKEVLRKLNTEHLFVVLHVRERLQTEKNTEKNHAK